MNEGNLQDALKKGNYEETRSGIFFPESKAIARGQFCYNKRGEPVEYSPNLLVDQGLDAILIAALGGGAQISTWYIAIFSAAVTPLATWTAANFAASATEITNYDEATREVWTPEPVSGGVISSYAAKATFTATTGFTARGAALISNSTKGGTVGTLAAASRFGVDKPLSAAELIDVGYQVTLTSA